MGARGGVNATTPCARPGCGHLLWAHYGSSDQSHGGPSGMCDCHGFRTQLQQDAVEAARAVVDYGSVKVSAAAVVKMLLEAFE